MGLQADGSDAAPSGVFTFPGGADITGLTFYLTAPARYSGDNFQVEATKCDDYGNALPHRVMGLSAVYTSWKRVFVERDKMFRRGGLLYANAAVNDTSVILYKNPDDTRWDNLNPGDKIAIFDTATPYEGAHDEAYVGTVTDTGSPPPGAPHQVFVTLITAPTGGVPYQLAHAYTASPVGAGYMPDFSQGSSAGIGVVYSTVPINGQTITDTSPNRLNGPGSAFYDADMRDIEQPFDDAYVEFFGLRSGMGAVPYVDPSAGLYASSSEGRSLRALFSSLWFENGPIEGNNYLHLMGVRGEDTGTLGGDTLPEDKESMICVQTWSIKYPNPGDAETAIQTATAHELGHQFYVNACAVADDCPKQAAANHHDYRPRWTDSTPGCPDPNANPCLMDPTGGGQTTGVNRLCKEDILLGDPETPCSYGTTTFQGKDTAIRTVSDPLPLSGVPGGP